MEKPKKRKKNKRRNNGNIPYIPEGKLQAAVPADIQKNMNESPEEFENPPQKKEDEKSETSVSFSAGAIQFPLTICDDKDKPKKRKKKKKKRKDNAPFIPEGKLQAAVPDDVKKNIDESPEEFENDPKVFKRNKEEEKEEAPPEPEAQKNERPRKIMPLVDGPKANSQFTPFSDLHKFPLPIPKRREEAVANVASFSAHHKNQLLSRLSQETVDILLHASRVIRNYSSAERDDVDLTINMVYELCAPKVIFVLEKPFDSR